MSRYTIVLEPNYPEEALERARESVKGFIEGLQKAGDPVPEEVAPAELETVVV